MTLPYWAVQSKLKGMFVVAECIIAMTDWGTRLYKPIFLEFKDGQPIMHKKPIWG